MSFFFATKKKVLNVRVDGKPIQEVRFGERDPIDKAIDKIKAKFELTDQETEGYNIHVMLRDIWATPDQTIADLLLRNNDLIYYHKQPTRTQQPPNPTSAHSERGISERSLAHEYASKPGPIPPEFAHQSMPHQQLYPKAGDGWTMIDGSFDRRLTQPATSRPISTPSYAAGLRQSVSDSNLHNQLHTDPRTEFLSTKTYAATGKVTLIFPKPANSSDLQLPPEIEQMAKKELVKPMSCLLERTVIERIPEKVDFEREEIDFIRYLALKRKIRKDLEEDKRVLQEIVRKEEEEKEKERQEAARLERERLDRLEREKYDAEVKMISLAPSQYRSQLLSDRRFRECYLILYRDRKVSPELAARTSCKFALLEANKTVFLHLCSMQIPTEVSELVAEDKTNMDEALNVAFSLCQLSEQHPDLPVKELKKIHATHLASPNAGDLSSFISSYKQMKGMGFPCEPILIAITSHPGDTAAALDMLLTGAS